MKLKKIVLDTSIIIDGKISDMLEKNEIEDLEEIIIPLAALDELQAQASKGREPGFVGLDEIKKLRKIIEDKKITLRFTGERPTMEDIKLAKSGRLDAMIRDVAKDEGATLVTADFVQALVAEAEGVNIEHIAQEITKEKLEFEKYFTPDTMSIHLKEDVVPLAKRGKPGNFKLQQIGKDKITREELQKMINEIVEVARRSEDAFIEAETGGSLVVQLGLYRIAIARRPFSDGLEMTVVRPIVKLSLKDYNLSEKLIERLKKKAEGILVCGPPGAGKSCFATGLAEFYLNQGKIVKTLESPRDLQVGPEITQYGPLSGDFAKTADILLLVRPDYTIFDEIREAKNFKTFADMRLAGVGMIGVVHASEAIDSIQRFIGKIELGMIPHVVDTIIFIDAGQIKNVYELNLKVKVPTGMTEADLTRPVVEVRDFETGKLVYEIYTYGEENVVVPVGEKTLSPLQKLAKEKIINTIRKYDPNTEVEFLSDNRVRIKVSNKVVPRLIGRNGTNISKLEKSLGISIDVQPKVPSLGKEIDFMFEESGNSVILRVNPRFKGKNVNIYIDSDYLLSAQIGKKNEIKISKKSKLGEELLRAYIGKKNIRVLVD